MYLPSSSLHRSGSFLSTPSTSSVRGELTVCDRSPRWLYAKGQTEKALAFFIKYHGNKDPMVSHVYCDKVHNLIAPLRIRSWNSNGRKSKRISHRTAQTGAGGEPHISTSPDFVPYGKSRDFSVLFNTSSARYRSLMVIMMGVCGQFSGSGLGYFNTTIYKAVGYDVRCCPAFDLLGG